MTADDLDRLARLARQLRDTLDRNEVLEAQAQERNPLTPRQMAVVLLVAQGYSDKQIAERLTMTHSAVRHHITVILRKLELSDRTNLALWAWRRRLVTVDEAWETVMTMQWREAN